MMMKNDLSIVTDRYSGNIYNEGVKVRVCIFIALTLDKCDNPVIVHGVLCPLLLSVRLSDSRYWLGSDFKDKNPCSTRKLNSSSPVCS